MVSSRPFFSAWHVCSGTEPNITILAMQGLQSGRGKKGGKSKRNEADCHHQLQPSAMSSATGIYNVRYAMRMRLGLSLLIIQSTVHSRVHVLYSV